MDSPKEQHAEHLITHALEGGKALTAGEIAATPLLISGSVISSTLDQVTEALLAEVRRGRVELVQGRWYRFVPPIRVTGATLQNLAQAGLSGSMWPMPTRLITLSSRCPVRFELSRLPSSCSSPGRWFGLWFQPMSHRMMTSPKSTAVPPTRAIRIPGQCSMQ